VFDTETTDLARNALGDTVYSSDLAFYSHVHLLELGFLAYTGSRLLATGAWSVKPEGEVAIDEAALAVHRIDHAALAAYGRQPWEALAGLLDALLQFRPAFLVAHNAGFDACVLLTEARRAQAAGWARGRDKLET
jgi:DNA polymerase III epsilon subunit-like protein